MKTALEVDLASLRDRFGFAAAVQPLVGLIQRVDALRQEAGAPQFHVGVTSLGNLTMALANVFTSRGNDVRGEPLGGAGADKDPELAWIRAVVEGIERYATFVLEPGDYIVDSANNLGSGALDLSTVPKLSDREYADPRCPFRRIDSALPMRWVKGYSLTSECERYVPAVMTHLYMTAWDSERFWQPITTGVAGHTSLSTALVGAICEVIERDAIALTWLGRLELPRIMLDSRSHPDLARNLDAVENSAFQHLFFDATTDIGVPAVYAIQLADHHPQMAQYVGCACGFDPAALCAKLVREAAASRISLLFPRSLPDDISDFFELHHGALYLGRPERRDAFGFLLNSPGAVSLSALRQPWLSPANDDDRLRFLVARLRELKMEAIAVDLTPDEVRELGLSVIRVVIPQLMPMSSIQRARYLGHPRLYSYLNTRVDGFTEADVNPAPQPFA